MSTPAPPRRWPLARLPFLPPLSRALSLGHELACLWANLRSCLTRLGGSAFLVEGQLRGRLRARMLFVGRPERKDEASRLFFEGPTQTMELERVRSLNFKAAAKELSEAAFDLVVWEAWPGEKSQDTGPWVMQPWLDARVHPGPNLEAYLLAKVSASRRRYLKKGKERGLALTRSRSAEDAAFFHHRLLVPMLERRWGKDLLRPSLSTLLAWNGRTSWVELLFLEKEGRKVAGSALVISQLKREVMSWGTAALPEVMEDAQLRAAFTPMLDAAGLSLASEQDMAFNFSLTRPFLDDGPLQSKRQWGCALQPIPGFSRFGVQFAPHRQRALLSAAPLLHLAADGLRGAAAVPDGPDGVECLRGMLAQSSFEGLRGVTVLSQKPASLAPLAEGLWAQQGLRLQLVASA